MDFQIMVVQGQTILLAHVQQSKQSRLSLAVHIDKAHYYNELGTIEPVEQVKAKVQHFTQTEAINFLARAQAHFRKPRQKRLQDLTHKSECP